MANEKHLTPDEVAARWDCHKATILRKFHAGDLPGILLSQGKTRATIRFRLSTIEAWERKRERSGGVK